MDWRDRGRTVDGEGNVQQGGFSFSGDVRVVGGDTRRGLQRGRWAENGEIVMVDKKSELRAGWLDRE